MITPKYTNELIKKRMQKKLIVTVESDCWTWDGACSKQGFGIWTINKEMHRVHRLAYRLWVDENLPKHAIVEQICGNRLCCNPAHLRIEEDSLLVPAKTSVRRGQFHWQSKLTPEQIVEIRRLYDSHEKNQMQIAKIFNTNQPTISRIIKRKVWRHV